MFLFDIDMFCNILLFLTVYKNPQAISQTWQFSKIL